MKEWFLHNWQLKALALVLATLTWVFVKGITNDHRTITDIPLEIRVGSGRVLEYATVSHVNVTISGTRDDIRRLSRLEIVAMVDLTDQNRIGEWKIPLGSAVIRHPEHVRLTDVSPSHVTVRIDDLAQREVRVNPTIVGELASGFRLDRAFVSPQRVRVQGPKTYVDGLQILNTQPVDLAGRRSSFRDRVAVETPPGQSVTVDPRWVDVDLRIIEAPLPPPEPEPSKP